MELFYTVSSGYNAGQTSPSASLGGFKSSTPVTNDDFGNIFDDISVMTIKSAKNEYRAIILKNTTGVRVNNVKIFLETQPDSICEFKISKGEMMAVNKYNQSSMESVSSPNNKPFRASFINAPLEDPLVIDFIEDGAEIGIWVMRSINQEKAKEQYNTVCVKDDRDPTGRRYKAVTHKREDGVNINISWD